MRRYVIFCDESEKDGPYFGNFYGGALVRGEHFELVEKTLKNKVADLNFSGEIKWSKITTINYNDYIQLMEAFFQLIRADMVKVRIFFTQNAHEPNNLSREQKQNEYYLLYYQFIKHAFGLRYSNPTNDPVRLEILFDKLPNNHGHRQEFKQYIVNLQNQPEFVAANILLTNDALSEVDSKNHIILQCLDVVMGSINFRLNDLHKAKPPGRKRRGKKTIVKERVYKRINQLIREIRPGFNIGETTGIDGDYANRWRHPYRHWKFKSSDSTYNKERTKGAKK